MNTSRENKKKEAIDRMNAIGLYPETIKQFEEDDKVSRSVPPSGACYWIDDDLISLVQEFEKENDALVYHVISGTYLLGGSDIMTMDTFFYVSDHPEEWELDRDDIEHGRSFCYIYNETGPELSESGPIGFEVGPAGGLLRTW